MKYLIIFVMLFFSLMPVRAAEMLDVDYNFIDSAFDGIKPVTDKEFDDTINRLTPQPVENTFMGKLKAFFKPEFLNRLDEIITFHALKKEHIRQIVDIQIDRLQQRLKDHHIQLALTDKAKDWLAENGYDAEFGARPLKRLIQQELENPLAIKLLAGDIRDNAVVQIDVKNNRLDIQAK